jgi:hypothetical protein
MPWADCNQPQKTGRDPRPCIAGDMLEKHRAIRFEERSDVAPTKLCHLAIQRGCGFYDDIVGSSKKSIRTKQPPVPGNTTSSKPPTHMSCPILIRAVQNKPLSTHHSCKGMSTTTSSTPLSPPCNRSGPPEGLILPMPNPTMDSL